MIVDANILLYAVDVTSPWHERAEAWLTRSLRGSRRVGLPWQSLGAFARLSTNPRLFPQPLTPEKVSETVDTWLASPAVWVPAATATTWRIYSRLSMEHQVTGNGVPDAQLAALALEYGVAVVSADSDFVRFTEVRWINPLTERTEA